MPTTIVERPRLPDCPVDRWLRFESSVDKRYEREHECSRVAGMRHAIIVGLALYNTFNFSDLILLLDVAWQTILVRVLFATPTTMALFWTLPRVSACWRERLAALTVTGAALLPVPGFVVSQAPLALFAFSEFYLSFVFANMLLALRFRHACVVTFVCFVAGAASLLARDVGGWITIALVFQLTTVSIFSLYANYLMERRRCESYLAELLAKLHSEADEQARVRFQELAVTDGLTGLSNRRLLNARLDEWSEQGIDVVVAMIDVDHFKIYNDTLGHPAGDECLRRVAAVLHSVSDDHIVAARYGGEEFTLAMIGIDEFDAVRIVQDVLERIKTLDIHHPGRRDGIMIVTASAGVAITQAGDWTATGVLASADEALYEAKRAGRARLSITPQTKPVMTQSTLAAVQPTHALPAFHCQL